MDEDLKKQQQLYDEGWSKELAAGKEQRGNLQANLEFLSQTGLLKPNDKILEIGCGIGLVGIIATKTGHDLTMTEYDPHALKFACANAQINKCSNLKIKRLNWHQTQLREQFNGIVGSEVLYKKKDFPSLLELFKTCLKRDGEVILVEEMRKTDLEFYKIMEPF